MAGSARDPAYDRSPTTMVDAVTVVATRRCLAMDTGDEGVSRVDANPPCPSPYTTPAAPLGKEARSRELPFQLSPDAAEFFSPAQSTPPDTNSPTHPSHNSKWPGFAATATQQNTTVDSPTLFPPAKGPTHVSTPDASLTNSLLAAGGTAAGDTAIGAAEEGGSKAQQQLRDPQLIPQEGTTGSAWGMGRGRGGRGGRGRGAGVGTDSPTAIPVRKSSRIAEMALAAAGAITQAAAARVSDSPATRGARPLHA